MDKNMPTPIKREDIRKGDRISVTDVYIAEEDGGAGLMQGDVEYTLIERPVEMPTEPGWYLDKNTNPIQIGSDGRYRRPGQSSAPGYHFRSVAPLTRLRTEPDLAGDIFSRLQSDAVATIGSKGNRIEITAEHFKAVASDYGVRALYGFFD